MKKCIKTLFACLILTVCMSMSFLVTNHAFAKPADKATEDPIFQTRKEDPLTTPTPTTTPSPTPANPEVWNPWVWNPWGGNQWGWSTEWWSSEGGSASSKWINFVLERIATGWPIGINLTVDSPEWKWAESVNNWIVSMIWYLINIFVIIGIVIAFIGWYQIMTSSKEDSYKNWLKFVIFWVVWIIIMVSAKWIANVLVWDWWIMPTDMEPGMKGISLANNIYTQLAYPLIKIILYLVMGILFFVMAGKVITYIMSTDDVAKKKAGGIILRTVIWILIIMWSKQIVESVIWTQKQVIDDAIKATQIQEIGYETLEFWPIPIVAEVINRVMWLAMFAVLILLIIQTYRMVFKPADPENWKRLKKTLLYVIIWVLVIWASYIISNVLVIK